MITVMLIFVVPLVIVGLVASIRFYRRTARTRGAGTWRKII